MNTDLCQRGDRHLRPDPQGVLGFAANCKAGNILITMDPEFAETSAGQHCAWMLVNLLARQFGVVAEISLIIPPVDLLRAVAAFACEKTLGKTLEACVGLIGGVDIRTNLNPSITSNFDFAISLGGVISGHQADRQLSIFADGWRWYVGSGKDRPHAQPVSTLSFGPYMAASFAAGEVFKSLRGMLPGKGVFIDEFFGSLWSMSTADSWEQLEVGPEREHIPDLGQFYFAGAGAVAQSAALTLGSSALMARTIAIDDDTLDLTNGNRYVLTTTGDANQSKVELIKKYLDACGIQCHAAPVKWNIYAAACGKMAPNAELAALERNHKFSLVLSCVDKNIPRHELQTILPETLIGGSTDGLSAKVSVFYLPHDAACLKCFNKPENRNETIRRNLAEIATYDSARRTEWCAANNVSDSELRRLMALPKCGTLTEADLDRFGNGTPDMSVGFVSAVAGVLLAAQLTRIKCLGLELSTAKGSAVFATFSTAGLRQRKIGRDHGCECETILKPRWRKLWGR